MDQTLTIRRVPLTSLNLDPANARQHPATNVAAIKASLARFGQAEPLVVHKPTQRVIGGNGRLVAMRELGWTECDVVELDISEVQATALAIALNRTAETAEWDLPALTKLLESIRAEDTLDGVGFDDAELDQMLADLAADLGPAEIDDPGPGEPPVTPVTRTGDLWILGAHRLLCGDSTSAQDVARLMDGEKAALFATDAPYCVSYTGNNRPIHEGKSSGKDWSALYREIDIPDYPAFMDGFLTAVLPHTLPSAPIYARHAHTQQHVVAAVFAKHDILFHQVIVWVKPTPVFTHCFYQWQHEPYAFGWRRGNKPTHGIAQHSTVWSVDWEGKSRIVGNEHPTQKPLRLFELPMELHTKRGDVVVEPFSGSGTQCLAAERLGRRCFAMEIQPAFVDVAVRRWEAATGKQATFESTGATFASVRADRLPSDIANIEAS
jgi:DNA modification methylase